MTEVRKS